MPRPHRDLSLRVFGAPLRDLPGRAGLLHADHHYYAPSDSRCAPLDFTPGSYERSLPTTLRELVGETIFSRTSGRIRTW